MKQDRIERCGERIQKHGMMHRMQKPFVKLFNIIEFFIGILIIIVIAILAIHLVGFIVTEIIPTPSDAILMEFLEMALTLVIGIEFVKMLCNHNPETIIDVLLFAIARHLIVEKQEISQMLMGVLSIAILFLVRKYLFLGNKKGSVKSEGNVCGS